MAAAVSLLWYTDVAVLTSCENEVGSQPTGRARIKREGEKMPPLLFCLYAGVLEISPFALKSRRPQRRLSWSKQTFSQLSLRVIVRYFSGGEKRESEVRLRSQPTKYCEQGVKQIKTEQ